MKEKITKEPITNITSSLWQARILAAAIKLNIFDVIKEVQEIDKIASRLNLKLDSLRRLLNALVAMNFLDKKDDSYFNKPISKKFLVKSSSDYYGDFVIINEDADDSWKKLDEIIQTGTSITTDNRERLAVKEFTRAMHNNAQAPAKTLSNLIDFSGKSHLLDVGGGSGAFSIILTNKYVNLKATVVEQPSVCKTAQEYVEKEGDTKRIHFLSGDYFKLEFPVHDLALFGQIFHSNSPEQNISLLQKTYDKIEKNGLVLITEFLLNEDKTSPLFPALFNLNMLKQTQGGQAYTFSEIKIWLEKVGFQNVKKKHLAGPHTLIIANK